MRHRGWERLGGQPELHHIQADLPFTAKARPGTGGPWEAGVQPVQTLILYTFAGTLFSRIY